ncbi:ATP-dependent metallopeptidase FtsH/Yme1/Tma family protein [Flindersiella endophytica]
MGEPTPQVNRPEQTSVDPASGSSSGGSRGTGSGPGSGSDLGPGAGQGAEPERTRKPWRTEGLPESADGKTPRRRFNWKYFLITLVAVYLLSTLVSWMIGGERAPTIPYTEFTKQVAAGNVERIFSKGESIQGDLKKTAKVPEGAADETYDHFTTERPTFAEDDLYKQLTAKNVTVQAEPVLQQRSLLTSLLMSLLPIALLAGVWIWLIRRQSQIASGGLGGLGRSKAAKPVEPSKIRVDFNDVAGIDEAKQELTEVVDFLREPAKYQKLGARVPKGVLLAGQPGTGKTLLARATAGEAGVPFFSASASEFIEMIVGVGASRVRELFSEARKVAPSIIFIDEIDTIGRARGGQTLGGHDEREQTLNQILTEMDGFTGFEGVIVVAATNRPDVLDPALLRPGRFDRSVMVSPPDVVGRAAILRVHVRGVPLASEVDLEQIAKTTPGMTGADLANLVNEAALLAARRERPSVTPADFSEALEKIQLGAARTIVIPDTERERTAYHEAGHALLGMLQPGADPVRKISIIPRGRALGVTLSTPNNDRYAYDEKYLRGRIIGALGGMAAEEVVYDVVTTGAESDLDTVAKIARGMVGRWGMSRAIGPVTVLPDPATNGQYPIQVAPATMDTVDREVRRIVEECYSEAIRQLRDNRSKLDAIVRALLSKETLDEAEAYSAAGVDPATSPT